MDLKIIGKNFDVGQSLRTHVEERLQQLRQKYFDRTIHAQVIFVKQRHIFQTECTVHLATGLVLNAQGEAADALASFEAAASHLENQLRRYRQRLKSHQRNHINGRHEMAATEHIIQSTGDDDERAEKNDELKPVIIAESATNVPELSVGEAVLALEISTAPFVLFKNSTGGTISLVYRRHDGNIGWLDPGQTGGAS